MSETKSPDGETLFPDLSQFTVEATGGGWAAVGTLTPSESKMLESFEPPKYSMGGLISSWSSEPLSIGMSKWIGSVDFSDGKLPPHLCPHCGRPRHTQPLRENVAIQIDGHRFNPDYDASRDNSQILCVGSDTYGPPRPRASDYLAAPSMGYSLADLGDMKNTLWSVKGAPWVVFADGTCEQQLEEQK